ncbi:hypothetical protein B0H63DRAFT_467150 [Podospora didyma]|uniref:Rhodopsin domain-containing protein n=1 Tax=Podospora didyma TaxID=330526 RepID=A0AAE0P0Y7_9PEZI|nr:hypothetical protein B0H63DRAFT_467150 [Podospora didyma]
MEYGPEPLTNIFKLMIPLQFLWAPSLAFSKISIPLLYSRVFAMPLVIWAARRAIVFIALWATATILVGCLICRPFSFTGTRPRQAATTSWCSSAHHHNHNTPSSNKAILELESTSQGGHQRRPFEPLTDDSSRDDDDGITVHSQWNVVQSSAKEQEMWKMKKEPQKNGGDFFVDRLFPFFLGKT